MEADIGYIIPELRFAMAGYFEVTLEHKNAKNLQVTSNVLTNKNNAFHFHLKWSQ